MRTDRVALALAALLLATPGLAPAAGVTAYLPMNLEPEIERQIERVLILADEPILKRPFAVALVELALPQACLKDKPLCTKVQRYLERYYRDYAVTHASASAAIAHGNSVMPNQHGMPVDSNYEFSLVAYAQPTDYFLISGGGVAYEGRFNPTGSMLSFGTNWAQLDIGYRDHWLSPMTDSSSLLSTEAPTTLSATLSNYEPLTSLGLQYEIIWTRLSTNLIDYNDMVVPGKPNLFGVQLSVEPMSGWSIGANRLLEYGGGNGLPSDFRFLLRDFFRPSGQSQLQGNQQASYISRFIMPGKVPFAVYFQYAGENNSNGGSYLLGDPATSAGIDFPRFLRHFDATYEISEWTNAWYVHYIYLDGMTNDHLVLGNWGADQRNFGDGVGARSQMLRVGWEPPFGGYMELRARLLQNQTYYGGNNRTYVETPSPYPYYHYYDLDLRYSRPWNGVTVGAEAFGGRDVDGSYFSRLSGFVRYGGDSRTRDDGAYSDDDAESSGGQDHPGTEVFVDAGANANKVRADINQVLPITTTPVGYGPHFALGARRAVSASNDLGVRAEFDVVDGYMLIGLRPIDYRHRFDGPLAMSVFAGIARWDLATPATSLYGGLGVSWRDILPKWDLNLDFRYAQALARDRMLASDPTGPRPEAFYKIESVTLYASRRF
jgi:Capsule assembly protein Wzi